MTQPPHAKFLRSVLDQLQRDNGAHPTCDDCGNPQVLVPCHSCGRVCQWVCPLMFAYQVYKAYDLNARPPIDTHDETGSTGAQVRVQAGSNTQDLADYFHAGLWPLIIPLERALVIDLIERTPVRDPGDPVPVGHLAHKGLFPETEDALEIARLVLEDLAEDPYDEEAWTCWELLADGVEPDDAGCFPPKGA